MSAILSCAMRSIKSFVKSKFPKLFLVGKRIWGNYLKAIVSKDPKLADLFRLSEGIERYAFSKEGNVRQDLVNKFGFAGDLVQIFSSEQDPVVHKWHHYIPIYERYFEKYRGQEVKFLEIGVAKGGSLRMWREYLGPKAVIFGIDIDQNCSKLNGVHGQVRIGSQDDSYFLSSVISEMGGVDVVLDDGSHDMERTASSMKILFPQLNQGGTYLIEDLHTAYWRGFGGGYYSKDNLFRMVPKLINDIHSWYHPYGKKSVLSNDVVSSIHIHDSILVLEKDISYPPTHSQVGFKKS